MSGKVMQRCSLGIMLLVYASAITAEAPNNFKHYTLDAKHTKVGFEISHLVFATIDGQFNKFQGSFAFDEKANQIQEAKVEIDVSSINTGEDDRDKHLKSADFFDIEKHPQMLFDNVKLTAQNGKPKTLTGNLRLHGVDKKDVTLDVDFKGFATDPWGNKKLIFNLSGKINRKDFGLNWNKTLDNGGLMIGEEVKLVIKVEAVEVIPKKG